MMVSTYALIEQIHSLPQKNKQNQSLINKLERFIDILTVRAHHKDLEQVSSDLLNDVLELRLKSIEFLLEDNQDISYVLNKVSPTLHSSYKNLNTTFYEVVSTQFKIGLSAISSNSSNTSFGSLLNGMEIDASISFNGLKKLVQLYPVSNMINFLKWLESSLKLEIGMCICALIENEIITVPNDKFIEELQSFLNSKLELFGAYAMLLNIWQPNEDDDTQLIRNIKIVASAYELDAKKGKRITPHDLQKLLLVA